jgi:hypothetical protein
MEKTGQLHQLLALSLFSALKRATTIRMNEYKKKNETERRCISNHNKRERERKRLYIEMVMVYDVIEDNLDNRTLKSFENGIQI